MKNKKIECWLIPTKQKIRTIGNNGFYYFKSSLDDNSIYLWIHGNEKGHVLFKGEEMTPKQVLEKFIPILKKLKVDSIFTISCFGGLQIPAKIGKYSIESCHEFKEEIISIISEEGLKYAPISNL